MSLSPLVASLSLASAVVEEAVSIVILQYTHQSCDPVKSKESGNSKDLRV